MSTGVVAVLSIMLQQTDLVLIALEQTPPVGVVEALDRPRLRAQAEAHRASECLGAECRRPPSRCSPSSSAFVVLTWSSTTCRAKFCSVLSPLCDGTARQADHAHKRVIRRLSCIDEEVMTNAVKYGSFSRIGGPLTTQFGSCTPSRRHEILGGRSRSGWPLQSARFPSAGGLANAAARSRRSGGPAGSPRPWLCERSRSGLLSQGCHLVRGTVSANRQWLCKEWLRPRGRLQFCLGSESHLPHAVYLAADAARQDCSLPN
jgi:hypothetical protein